MLNFSRKTTSAIYVYIFFIFCACYVSVVIINWLILVPGDISKPIYNRAYQIKSNKELEDNLRSIKGNADFRNLVKLPITCTSVFSGDCNDVAIDIDGELYRILQPQAPIKRLDEIKTSAIFQHFNKLSNKWVDVISLDNVFGRKEKLREFRINDSLEFQLLSERNIYISSDKGKTWKQKPVSTNEISRLDSYRFMNRDYDFKKYFNLMAENDRSLDPSFRSDPNKTILNIKQSDPSKYIISNVNGLMWNEKILLLWNDNRFRNFETVQRQCNEITGCNYYPHYNDQYNIFLRISSDGGNTWGNISKINSSENFMLVNAYVYRSEIRLLLKKDSDYYSADISLSEE